MKRARLLALALGLGLMVPLAACVERVETRDVVVSRPPPAPIAEEVPAPPPGPPEVWVWQRGHWRWNGRDYVWVHGRYVERPHRTAHWVPPHWQPREGGWIYISGHWQ